MKFPTYSRVRYKQNLLAEVVCQVKFPRILAIDAELPVDFQQRVSEWYPILTHTRVQLSTPNSASDAKNDEDRQGSSVFVFENVDKTEKVALASDSVAFSTTAYLNWDTFSEGLARVLNLHSETYAPRVTTRIGLRYLDIIERQKIEGLDGKAWAELVRPELLGLLARAEAKESDVRQFESTAVAEVDGGFLTLRTCLVQNAETKNVCMLLDADVWTEQLTESNHEALFKVLAGFRETAGSVFDWATSNELRNALGVVED